MNNKITDINQYINYAMLVIKGKRTLSDALRLFKDDFNAFYQVYINLRDLYTLTANWKVNSSNRSLSWNIAQAIGNKIKALNDITHNLQKALIRNISSFDIGRSLGNKKDKIFTLQATAGNYQIKQTAIIPIAYDELNEYYYYDTFYTRLKLVATRLTDDYQYVKRTWLYDIDKPYQYDTDFKEVVNNIGITDDINKLQSNVGLMMFLQFIAE